MDERLWGILMEALPRILYQGCVMTLPLAVGSFLLAVVIAVITALIQYAKVPVLKEIARFYVWIIRGTPLLVQLYVVFYGLPNLGILLPAVPSALLVLSLNEGAYCAEAMRGALDSVPVGQLEAGACVGLSWVQTMWHVVLPQAFRVAFPSLGNGLISLVKDTSLAMTITVPEMFMSTIRIAGRTYEYLSLYIEVALVYLLICTVLSKVQSVIEKRLSRYAI